MSEQPPAEAPPPAPVTRDDVLAAMIASLKNLQDGMAKAADDGQRKAAALVEAKASELRGMIDKIKAEAGAAAGPLQGAKRDGAVMVVPLGGKTWRLHPDGRIEA